MSFWERPAQNGYDLFFRSVPCFAVILVQIEANPSDEASFSLVASSLGVGISAVFGSWNRNSPIVLLNPQSGPCYGPTTLRFKGQMSDRDAKHTIKLGKRNHKDKVLQCFHFHACTGQNYVMHMDAAIKAVDITLCTRLCKACMQKKHAAPPKPPSTPHSHSMPQGRGRERYTHIYIYKQTQELRQACSPSYFATLSGWFRSLSRFFFGLLLRVCLTVRAWWRTHTHTHEKAENCKKTKKQELQKMRKTPLPKTLEFPSSKRKTAKTTQNCKNLPASSWVYRYRRVQLSFSGLLVSCAAGLVQNTFQPSGMK